MQFKIEPRLKKSFIEIYTFTWGDFHAVQEHGWRWGSLWVTVGEDEYLPSQFDIFEAEDFDEWELQEAWDGCWSDWSVTYTGSKEGWTPEQKHEMVEKCSAMVDDLERDWAEEGWEAIDNSEWEQQSYNIYIHNEWRITDVAKGERDE